MAEDRGETADRMRPMKVGEGSPRLPDIPDLALDLESKAIAFWNSLPHGIQAALARLVRFVHCYYNNLIAGHDTHPIDIERALNNDLSADPERRNLQHEAKAHIAAQEWIDAGGLAGRAHTTAGLAEILARFCENLPDELLWVEAPVTGERVRVEPG